MGVVLGVVLELRQGVGWLICRVGREEGWCGRNRRDLVWNMIVEQQTIL